MGYDFAVIFNEFLKKRGYPVSSIGVVGANPEQSKHLQTAIVDILNLKVDFVNMRNEMYAQDSRIPAEIAFGSAEEDSHRRDTTINSLYYNIMTGLVEDWTRLGIQDLEQGIIRTPLAARDIFADDPLRILRCLRFAARFNFKLDGEIIASLEDSQMRLSLLRKVSRERIGIEIKKMLTCSRDAGEAPIRALQFLHYLELMPIIYQVPYSVIKSGVFIAGGDPYRESFELFQIFTTHFYTKLGCLLPNLNSNSPTNTKYLPEDFHEQHQHEDVIQHQMTSLPICWPLEKHSLFLIWNALSMLPFRGQVCHMPEISKNPIPLIEYISHISLKVKIILL